MQNELFILVKIFFHKQLEVDTFYKKYRSRDYHVIKHILYNFLKSNFFSYVLNNCGLNI